MKIPFGNAGMSSFQLFGRGVPKSQSIFWLQATPKVSQNIVFVSIHEFHNILLVYNIHNKKSFCKNI